MPLLFSATASRTASATLDVRSVHHEHAEFVWLTLQRLGVRDADIEDVLQEVFVVVHKRLHTFDASARMSTWLFGICLRVAASYRRRAHRRRETVSDLSGDAACAGPSPEEAAATLQARGRLRAILDGMDLDKRAIFVMYELDELSCDAIAEVLSIPVGTVHSRLHAARKAFARSLARLNAREAPGKGRRPEGGP